METFCSSLVSSEGMKMNELGKAAWKSTFCLCHDKKKSMAVFFFLEQFCVFS